MVRLDGGHGRIDVANTGLAVNRGRIDKLHPSMGSEGEAVNEKVALDVVSLTPGDTVVGYIDFVDGENGHSSKFAVFRKNGVAPWPSFQNSKQIEEGQNMEAGGWPKGKAELAPGRMWVNKK